MFLKRKPLTILMCAIASASQMVYAQAEQKESTRHDLGEINIVAESERTEANLLGTRQNVSDHVIQSHTLKQRATTLGDALGSELGIHSNQFGGGASAPIIRGQEGKRITILQNNADVIDMAHLSPDHAVMVDTVLAKQAEVVRGVSTLLYKSGNSAGAVNIIDNKIPTTLPKKPFEGEVGLRFNTGNNEKLTTAAATAQVGSNVVVHIEGLNKDAGNYHTPSYTLHQFSSLNQLDNFVKAPERLARLDYEYEVFKRGEKLNWRENQHYISSEQDYLDKRQKFTEQITSVPSQTLDYLPESWARSKAGSLGVSWVGDQGYIGVAMSERQDKYGLPAHNQLYEGCSVISIFDSYRERPYLKKYPQLIDVSDVNYINPRPDCLHAHGNGASHGIQSKHEHAPPYVDLTTRRYDLRAEWDNPTTWIQKVRSNIGYVDYQHDEKEGHVVNTSFKNKGKVARLELTHQPLDRLKVLWGLQYIHQDNSAISPVSEWRTQQILTENQLTNRGLFAMGQYDFDKVQIELGTRLEKQKIAMDYDLNYIENEMRKNSFIPSGEKLEEAIQYALNATKPHEKIAHSYALGIHWKFLPQHTLSFNVSQQERLPNSQELYTHGMHLATNSFEIGNRHLTKEKSKNYELGFAFKGEKLDYKLSGYIYDFDNYIYLQTINEHLGTARVNHFRKLRINRYDQSPAKFYGGEFNIGYQVSPVYHVSTFVDYVKGRLHDLPDIVVDYRIFCFGPCERKKYGPQEDRYSPRLPPMRAGLKIKADFDDRWSGDVEYTHTFTQKKISKFEETTVGNDLLNLGLNYVLAKGQQEYALSFKANNLLDRRIYAHETFLPYIPQMGRNFQLGVNWKF